MLEQDAVSGTKSVALRDFVMSAILCGRQERADRLLIKASHKVKPSLNYFNSMQFVHCFPVDSFLKISDCLQHPLKINVKIKITVRNILENVLPALKQ